MTPMLHNEATLRAQQRIAAAQRARQYLASRREALEELDPHLIVLQIGWHATREQADAAIDGYLSEQWVG